MWETIQENIAEIICSGVAAFAASILVYALKKFKGFSKLLRADSRDKIMRFGNFYILTNEITATELDSLVDIYEGYHDLGGNGTVTEIYERCLELPLVKERTKWNPYYIGQDGYIGK